MLKLDTNQETNQLDVEIVEVDANKCQSGSWYTIIILLLFIFIIETIIIAYYKKKLINYKDNSSFVNKQLHKMVNKIDYDKITISRAAQYKRQDYTNENRLLNLSCLIQKDFKISKKTKYSLLDWRKKYYPYYSFNHISFTHNNYINTVDVADCNTKDEIINKIKRLNICDDPDNIFMNILKTTTEPLDENLNYSDDF